MIPQIASAIHTFASRHLNRFQTTTKKKKDWKKNKGAIYSSRQEKKGDFLKDEENSSGPTSKTICKKG